jgi:ParB family chromosome partitioning protein
MARELLLVEADTDLADSVRRAFAPAGFVVTTVGAGEAAVERVRSMRPDLVLLDAELPDMSGFSVCNRIKRTLGSVPLILYTSEASDQAIEAHRQTRTRADEYLRKPLDLADLLGRAAHLLQSDAAAPAAAPGPKGPPVLQRVPPVPADPGGRAAPRRAADGVEAKGGPPPLRPTLSFPLPEGGLRPAPPGAAVTSPAPRPPAPAARPPDAPDLFVDWPRDPAPPRGTPEEKLEFFRERLKAKDAFLGRVREAFGALRAEVPELRADRDRARHDLEEAAAVRADLETRLRLAAQAAARQAEEARSRAEALEARAGEADRTRQSLSEVLSDAIAAREETEKDLEAKLAAAEGEIARLGALREQESGAAAEALAAEQAARAGERVARERERSDLEAALADGRAERERERAQADADLAAARGARDEVASEVARLQARLEQEAAAGEESQREAQERSERLERELAAERSRAEASAGELAEATGRIGALEAEAERRTRDVEALGADLEQARRETGAHQEKAVALEQAYGALQAELQAARKRAEELAQLLDERNATVEEVQGQVARITRELSEASHREARLAADKAELAQKVASELQAHERTAGALAALQAESDRLRALEPAAQDAPRLRRELAVAQELLQQRTQQVETAARSAHQATADREKLRERAAVEIQNSVGELARRDSEVASLRRRLAELESERTAREAESRRLQEEVLSARRARAEEAAEAERRGGAEAARLEAEAERRLHAETGRLRAALVELERRLEASVRAEGALRRRISELERGHSDRGLADRAAAAAGERLAAAEQELARLREELEEMRSENDFLNGEVARYHQKNKELAALLKR